MSWLCKTLHSLLMLWVSFNALSAWRCLSLLNSTSNLMWLKSIRLKFLIFDNKFDATSIGSSVFKRLWPCGSLSSAGGGRPSFGLLCCACACAFFAFFCAFLSKLPFWGCVIASTMDGLS